jgi:hypothetical protein
MAPGMLGLSACLILAGCASGPIGHGGDRLEQPAKITYTSPKNPRAFADCVVAGWKTMRLKGSAISSSVRAEGALLRTELKLDDKPDQVLLVEAEGAGSKARHWNLGRYFGDKPVQVVAIENCR